MINRFSQHNTIMAARLKIPVGVPGWRIVIPVIPLRKINMPD